MEIVNNITVNQINYRLIKEENFIINLCKECFDNNNILMYSAHNEGKSVIAKQFIKTLNAKTCKQMTANVVFLI